MTEGMEDLSAGPAPPPGLASPTGSTGDTGQVPEEKPEETEAAGESGEEEGAEGAAEGGADAAAADDDGDGEHVGALGIVALPATCCVCIEVERINSCLHSEKICILPILACLLSLALCTAGLKWVFVDKIFEYEPPTHLDPKPIGQDPIIISVDPTLVLTVSVPHSSPSSTVSLTTTTTSTIAVTPAHPEVLVEEISTRGPLVPRPPQVTQADSSVTLKYNAERTVTPRQIPRPQPTQESNDIIVPSISFTSTTTKTSSHVTRCSDSKKNYCVNGGECFTLEITPGSTKFLCRCLAGFNGHRCEQAVLKTVSDPKQAEELYQKRILTISGICIALLVVGIMCVVGYCKTKRQRKELHDRLRQSVRNKRNNNTNTGVGPNLATSTRGRRISNLPLQDLQLSNQCNGMSAQHATEKETETTFSMSKYEPTTLTHISSHRFVSAMTQQSPVTSPATPLSPPSEMSAPLSSLAISVPSVALSPSGEEERPLLLSNIRQSHKYSSRDEQKRNSAHYNHGHMVHSLPPSPLFTMEDVDFEVMSDRDDDADHAINNNISDRSNKTALVAHGGGMMQEPRGDHTSFLATGCSTVLLLSATDRGRTNPASSNSDMSVTS
ncbi:pro-neuregulin-1, membrane-bound isoform isoform X3 [Solea solea]|uniref:pro-neuregulin-1, membrane-bound isoform isoform X3 n=1 Tax=Solea solea TaxID=90069 RepID=UPI00272D235E|nr:pro-neuregulin-1, membrane-bound isoform isoform X3 [Solea solea]